MATDRTFQTENAKQRERLKTLVARLSDVELRRSVGHGWTVAASLVHLAFWDLRAVTLFDKFAREGVGPSSVDVDVVNDTVRVLAESIPPRHAADLVVRAAEAVDRQIEMASDELLEAIGAAGNPVRLSRHIHRREHLDEITQALG
jgi:hypothetical protein